MMLEKFDLVVDASGAAMGRVASFAAKQSLLGKSVAIVNCDKAIITGNRSFTLSNYKHKRVLGGAAQKGPNFPSGTEKIMKRTVRGMLSYKQQRGRDALKRVYCFVSVPAKLQEQKKVSMASDTHAKSMSLGELVEDI